MSKLNMTVAGATVSVEGDDLAVTRTARQFHLMLAEMWLRDIEQQLTHFKGLHRERRKLVKQIAELKAAESADAPTEVM